VEVTEVTSLSIDIVFYGFENNSRFYFSSSWTFMPYVSPSSFSFNLSYASPTNYSSMKFKSSLKNSSSFYFSLSSSSFYFFLAS